MQVELKTEKCNKNNRDSIIGAMYNIACTDEDFNGNNGEEYLWDTAKEKGYTSNIDYVSNEVKGDNLLDIVNNFLSMWQDHDNYYSHCTWDYEDLNDNGDVLLAVSYCCG